MNRLYRGLRQDNNEWVYGHLVDKDYILRYVDLAESWEALTSDHKLTVRAYEVNPESVGQVTGLLDKNRKEIYEGDIVFSGNNVHGTPVCWPVVWHFDGWHILGIKQRPHRVNKGFWKTIEIIGNIHQHKHLLP